MFAGHRGVKCINKESFHETGKQPDDEWLIDEWIENGGKFADKGRGKRAGRPDRESKARAPAKGIAKGKKTGGKSTKAKGGASKRGRQDDKKKLTKEERKRKKAKLKKELELRLSLLSLSESDSDDDGVSFLFKKKGAVAEGCEAVRKQMEEGSDDDEDDDITVGADGNP